MGRFMARLFGAVVIMGCSTACMAGRAASQPATRLTDIELSRACLRGIRLSASEAGALEKRAKENPGDQQAHLELLGYTFDHSHDARAMPKARLAQVLWMIQNYPDARFSGSPFCQIDRDEEGYKEAKDAWMLQVKNAPQSGKILANAATFVATRETAEAERLLGKAVAAEPTNPAWHERLAALQMQPIVGGKADATDRTQVAKRALQEYEAATALTHDKLEKSYLLGDLAKAALLAGDEAKAKQYGDQLLAAAAEFPDDWNAGNAVYTGNSVLGRLALAHGDVEAAKNYLLASAKTQGSPQLDSFGPNTTLARDLLAKGEKETVLQYFELCGKFWKLGDKQLAQWTTAVKEGEEPKWGPNLVY